MDELIQSAGSLVGLAALVGVLVLFLLWWSMRRDRKRLHQELDLREWQLGLRELLEGDGRPQAEEPREESVPEPLQGDGSVQPEEPREESVPEPVRRVEEMKRRHGLERRGENHGRDGDE